MFKKLKENEKGFTIIEVLIVLAIAGLIMVIVFVAVPQLQKGQRNSARNNDASLIAAAISECMSNRNGVVASCNSTAAGEVSLPASLKEVTNATYDATAATWGTTSAAIWTFGSTCDAEGDGAVGGSSRQFLLKYQVEGGGNRCISG